jgi:hypothetical protein
MIQTADIYKPKGFLVILNFLEEVKAKLTSEAGT